MRMTMGLGMGLAASGGASAPIVTSVYPDVGVPAGGERLTVIGTGFAVGSTVKVGGVAATDVVRVSSTQLLCTAPAGDAAIGLNVEVTSGGVASVANTLYSYVAGGQQYFGAVQTAAATYDERDGARLEYFLGKWWMLGGWDGAAPPWHATSVTTNEVWSSPDLVTWTKELAHVEDPPTEGAGARWRKRHVFMTFVFGGYLWVMGSDTSDGSPVKSDVWRSADGTTWERVAASSPWGPLYCPIPAVYDGAMHVLGGQDGNAVARHWKSTDGVNWTQLTDMPFTRCAVTNAVVLHDKLYVIGGNSLSPGNAATQCSDTWEWDGATWTQTSANSGGTWSARDWNATASYDGRLWGLTGKAGAVNAGGLWSSTDGGATWIAVAQYAHPASHADAICAVEGIGIALASGSGMGTNTYLHAALPPDPSVTMAGLAWRLWFDGAGHNPVTATVAGKASAGTSGAKTTTPVSAPTSAMVNSFPGIVLDGVADLLKYTGGAGAADVVSNTAWTVHALVKIVSAPTNDTEPYNNGSVGSSSDANFAVDIRSNNTFQAYQYVGGNKVAGPKSWVANTLVLVQAKYDGTNIKIRTGKGAWSANVASGNPTIAGSSYSIGCKYNLIGAFVPMTVCEYAATNIAISDANLDLVADDMAAKWGVTV